MSFILEALRKSEQERQRHQSPGMADLRARNRTSGRPYWLPLVIFLVGINIGLLIFLWFNGTPATSPPVSGAPAIDSAQAIAKPEPSSAEVGSAEAQAISSEPVATGDAPTVAVKTELESAAATAIAGESAVADQPERSLSSELKPQPVRKSEPARAPSVNGGVPAPESAPSYGNLPTLTELTLAGTMSLAPLRIDMHVFSPQPSERFVFINMNKYREGDSLREGPVLNTITPDGIILDYQGRSFLVNRE